MAITLTVPDSPPQNTKVLLTNFGAQLVPDIRIICDYAYGRVVDGQFVPDKDKTFRRIFDSTTSPSLADFINNVSSAGNFRNQTENYIVLLDGLSGTVD